MARGAQSMPTHNIEALGALTGTPSSYDMLQTFFVHRADRRRALSVAENTIAAWDAGKASRVRKELNIRCAIIVSTCDRVQPFFDTPQDVGTFLLTKNYVFRDQAPITFIQSKGMVGAELVVTMTSRLFADRQLLDEKLGADDVFADDGTWKEVSEALPAHVLEYLPGTIRAVQAIAAKRGKLSVLD